ncbi:hypothetical protein TNCV_4981641 [Trichonephila clavipes]|nr:hypothetical protein TNCV_4981641 [Trichonephila clavipes]
MSKSPRHGPPEEKPLQLNQIQPGRYNQYNLRSRGDLSRKVSSRSSGRTMQVQKGPVRSRGDQFRRSSPYDLRHRRQSKQGRQEPEKTTALLEAEAKITILNESNRDKPQRPNAVTDTLRPRRGR